MKKKCDHQKRFESDSGPQEEMMLFGDLISWVTSIPFFGNEVIRTKKSNSLLYSPTSLVFPSYLSFYQMSINRIFHTKISSPGPNKKFKMNF